MAVKNIPFQLKITFVPGLKGIVLDELRKYSLLYPFLHTDIIKEKKDALYLDFDLDFDENISVLRNLRSILNVYIIRQGPTLNPDFISSHKSVLGDLIDKVILWNKTSAEYKGQIFKTFNISCAGAESKEVLEIQGFIVQKHKLIFMEDADMEIYIGKSDDVWEVGVRLTVRPLSLRDYRVANIKGGLNPTIAYAMNTFCNLESASSYMNIFSGSGTLLVEAGLSNQKLKLFGLDINSKSNTLAIQNIKKAGLIRSVKLKTADICDIPEDISLFGTLDVITSDLPFGMQISKNEDLEKLYRCFVEYSKKVLKPDGIMALYTTEHKILQEVLLNSGFNIVETLDLKIPTSVGAYIYPKIFVCKFL